MVGKITRKIEDIINFFEKTPLSITTFIISFFSIVSARIVIEAVILGFPKKNIDEFVGSLVHGTFLFFIFSYIIVLISIFLVVGKKLDPLVRILLWGQWLIVFPPIIDRIIFGDKQYWSFYLFDGPKNLFVRFFKFFGENPHMGITWGTRIMVLVASLFLGFYIYTKKRRVIWFFVGTLYVYLILFVLASVPSFISYFILPFEGISFFNIQSYQIAKIFLTENIIFGTKNLGVKVALHYKLALFYNLLLFFALVVLQYLKNKNQLVAIFKNIRFPQMTFNIGLFLVGVGLGWWYFPHNFSLNVFSVLALLNAGLAVFYAWKHSVFVNDIVDIEIDRVTNKDRPLVVGVFDREEYFEYGLVFVVLALLSAIVVSWAMFALVTAYLLITWAYSAYPFRLKRFVFVAGLLSSFTSLFFLISGYLLLSDNQTLQLFPWKIISFLFVVYALLIPIKDLKDIEGDKREGIFTFPVILGEENARILFGVLLFLSYIISVYIIGLSSLFLFAFVFGAISFWVLVDKKNNVRVLPWWVLGIAFVYGLIMVMKIFI